LKLRRHPGSDPVTKLQLPEVTDNFKQNNHSLLIILSLAPGVQYQYPGQARIIQETEDSWLIGEDPDADGEEQDGKPVRILRGFAIFDEKKDNIMFPLDALDSQNHRQKLVATGYATSYATVDEDEGQEDEEGDGPQPEFIRTNFIERWSFDDTIVNRLVCLSIWLPPFFLFSNTQTGLH
jgi:hypothetical protein